MSRRFGRPRGEGGEPPAKKEVPYIRTVDRDGEQFVVIGGQKPGDAMVEQKVRNFENPLLARLERNLEKHSETYRKGIRILAAHLNREGLSSREVHDGLTNKGEPLNTTQREALRNTLMTEISTKVRVKRNVNHSEAEHNQANRTKQEEYAKSVLALLALTTPKR
jgi:hypothetical protein